MMIAMRWPRYSRIWCSDSSSRFSPWNQTSPSTIWAPGRGTSRIRDRQVIVFPLPDSPTKPTASPFRMVKLTPSTALRTAFALEEVGLEPFDPKEDILFGVVVFHRQWSPGIIGLKMAAPGIQRVPQPVPKQVQ